MSADRGQVAPLDLVEEVDGTLLGPSGLNVAQSKFHGTPVGKAVLDRADLERLDQGGPRGVQIGESFDPLEPAACLKETIGRLTGHHGQVRRVERDLVAVQAQRHTRCFVRPRDVRT